MSIQNELAKFGCGSIVNVAMALTTNVDLQAGCHTAIHELAQSLMKASPVYFDGRYRACLACAALNETFRQTGTLYVADVAGNVSFEKYKEQNAIDAIADLIGI